jgi:hypothetical protein
MTFNSKNTKEASIKESSVESHKYIMNDDEIIDHILTRQAERSATRNSYTVH